MPNIYVPLDLAKGPRMPVTLVNRLGGDAVRTHALIDTTAVESSICPALARRLNLIEIGRTNHHRAGLVRRDVPFYQVDVRFASGLMGHDLRAWTLERVVVVEDDETCTMMRIGNDLLAQGRLSADRSGWFLCL